MNSTGKHAWKPLIHPSGDRNVFIVFLLSSSFILFTVLAGGKQVSEREGESERDHWNTEELCPSDPWSSAVLSICTICMSLWMKHQLNEQNVKCDERERYRGGVKERERVWESFFHCGWWPINHMFKHFYCTPVLPQTELKRAYVCPCEGYSEKPGAYADCVSLHEERKSLGSCCQRHWRRRKREREWGMEGGK